MAVLNAGRRIPTVGSGVGYAHSNNHAPNENIRIADYIDGINSWITLAPNESVTLHAVGASAHTWCRQASAIWKSSFTGNYVVPIDTVGGKSITLVSNGHAMQWGGRSSKGRLAAGLVADAYDSVVLSLNAGAYPFSSNPDNTSNASWALKLQAGSTDSFVVNRAPATSGVPAFANLMTLDATGTLSLPGQSAGSNLTLGAPATARGRLQVAGSLPGEVGLFANRDWLNSNVQDDASKPSWGLLMRADGADSMLVQRSPAGSTTQATLLTLDNVGNLTIPNAAAPTGFGLIAAGNATNTRLTAGLLATNAYFSGSWTQDTTAKPSYVVNLDTNGDKIQFFRMPPAGALTAIAYIDGSGSPPGNFVITGNVGQKATGTTWANPSDPRLKTDMGPYAKGLADILQLEPITYRLKSHPDGPLCYGFDATAVQPVFPECVTETSMRLDPADEEPTGGVLTLDIHPILVALINAIKDLNAKIGN